MEADRVSQPSLAAPPAPQYEDAERAAWRTPPGIRAAYPSASFLANNRIAFNIRGNHYRLIVQIHYNTQIVYIRFVGAHAEYDRIDASAI